MPSRRQVYIVDDETVVRRSMAFLLRSADYKPLPYASGKDFLRNADIDTPACLLLDLRMPGLDGIAVLEELGRRPHQLMTVMITGHGDVSSAVRAMRLGARDFVEKPFEEDYLVSILERVFSELEVQQLSLKGRQEAQERVRRLSARERDVLIGLMTGRSNKLIAHELGLSVRTIDMHRAKMMDRLAVTSLSDALRLAFEAGLFPSAGSGAGLPS